MARPAYSQAAGEPVADKQIGIIVGTGGPLFLLE